MLNCLFTIMFTCGKYLHGGIISLGKEVWPTKWYFLYQTVILIKMHLRFTYLCRKYIKHHDLSYRVSLGNSIYILSINPLSIERSRILPLIIYLSKSTCLSVGQPAWQESSKVKSQSHDFRFIFDEKWRSTLRLKYVGLQ